MAGTAPQPRLECGLNAEHSGNGVLDWFVAKGAESGERCKPGGICFS